MEESIDKVHECRICRKVFSKKSILKRHLLGHAQVKPFRCQVCNMGFCHKSSFKRHTMKNSCNMVETGKKLTRDILRMEKKRFMCNLCGAWFAYKFTLKQHMIQNTCCMKSAVGTSVVESEGHQVSAFRAEPQIEDLSKFHFTSTSSDDMSADESPVQIANNLESHIINEVLSEKACEMCVVCRKVFPSKTDLEIHVKEHVQRESPGSSVGMPKNSNVLDLKSQVNAANSTSYFTCQICGRSSPNLRGLKIHMLNCRGEHEHKCVMCGKIFGKRYLMTRHMKRHKEMDSAAIIARKKLKSSLSKIQEGQVSKRGSSLHKGKQVFGARGKQTSKAKTDGTVEAVYITEESEGEQDVSFGSDGEDSNSCITKVTEDPLLDLAFESHIDDLDIHPGENSQIIGGKELAQSRDINETVDLGLHFMSADDVAQSVSSVYPDILDRLSEANQTFSHSSSTDQIFRNQEEIATMIATEQIHPSDDIRSVQCKDNFDQECQEDVKECPTKFAKDIAVSKRQEITTVYIEEDSEEIADMCEENLGDPGEKVGSSPDPLMREVVPADGSSSSSCKKVSSSLEDVETQPSGHSSEPKNTCDICGLAFLQKNSLRKHMSEHGDKQKFKCSVCWGDFLFESDLIRHMESHREVCQIYTCNFCDMRFKKKCGLVTHLRTHTDVQTYSCDLCDKTFATKTPLQRHRKEHEVRKKKRCEEVVHGEQEGTTLTEAVEIPSTAVNLEAQSDTMLNNSAVAFKKETDNNLSEIPALVNKYRCKICQKAFDERSALLTHVKEHKTIGMTSQGRNLKYKCNICGRKFTHKCGLGMHMKVHRSDRPYSCRKCKIFFTSENSLRLHLYKHRNHMNYEWHSQFIEKQVQFSSDEGSFAFTEEVPPPVEQDGVLYSETPSNTSNVRDNCILQDTTSYVDKGPASQQEDSVSYTNIPSNVVDEKVIYKTQHAKSLLKYKCQPCGRLFFKKSSLILHSSIHVGDRPYPCTTCKLKFRSENSLRLHMYQHKQQEKLTEVSKLEAALIGASPSSHKRENDLVSDNVILTVESEEEKPDWSGERIPCPYCKKKCQTKSALANHIKTHAEYEHFPCKLCDLTFYFEDTLLSHQKRYHFVNKATLPTATKCKKENRTSPLTSIKNVNEKEVCKGKNAGHLTESEIPEANIYSGNSPSPPPPPPPSFEDIGDEQDDSDESHHFEFDEQAVYEEKSSIEGKCVAEGTVERNNGKCPFVCVICKKTFLYSRIYYRHKRSGNCALKALKCKHPGCSRSFKRRFNFERHMKVHARLKDCPFCGKTALRANRYERHVRSCSFRIFKGQEMDYSFSFKHKYDSQHHRKTHLNTRKCPYCEWKGLKGKSYIRHLRECHRLGLSRNKLHPGNLVHPSSGEVEGSDGALSQSKETELHLDCENTKLACTNIGPLSHAKDGNALSLCNQEAIECKMSGKEKNNYGVQKKDQHGKEIECDSDQWKKYCCTICNLNLLKPQSYTKHMEIHSELMTFSCTACGIYFVNVTAYTRHKATHAGSMSSTESSSGPSGELDICCGVCGKEFTDAADLANHKRTHSEYSSSSETEMKGLEVETVNKQAESKMFLGQSLDEERKNSKGLDEANMYKEESDGDGAGKIGDRETHPDKKIDKEEQFGQGEYKCNICSNVISSVVEFVMHLSSHKEEGDLKENQYGPSDLLSEITQLIIESPCCKKCEKVFCVCSALQMDGNNRKIDLYRCYICSAEFSVKWTFANHMSIHGDKVSLLKLLVDMTEDLRAEGKNRKYLCKRPVNNFLLDQEGRFECKVCGKLMLRRSNYVTHMKIHVCKGELKDHHYDPSDELFEFFKHSQKMHTCSECGKVLRTTRALRLHKKTHQKAGLYGCQICGKRFSTRAYYDNHMARHKRNKEAQASQVSGTKIKESPAFCQKKTAVDVEGAESSSCLVKGLAYNTEEYDREPSRCFEEFSNKVEDIKSMQLTRDKPGVDIGKSNDGDVVLSMTNNSVRDDKSSYEEFYCFTKKAYVCPVCGESFTRYKKLLGHQKIHIEPLMYDCDKCQQSFQSKEEYDEHYKTHYSKHISTMHECPVCGKKIAHVGNFKRHYSTHTEEEINGIVSDFRLSDLIEDGGHTIEFSDDQEGSVLPGDDEKEVGDTKLRMQTSLIESDTEQDENKSSEDTSPVQSKGHKSRQDVSFHCILCDLFFFSLSDFQKHDVMHEFTCRYCGHAFDRKSKCTTHVSRHTVNDIKCSYCWKRFLRKREFDNHMKSHKGEVTKRENDGTPESSSNRTGKANFINKISILKKKKKKAKGNEQESSELFNGSVNSKSELMNFVDIGQLNKKKQRKNLNWGHTSAHKAIVQNVGKWSGKRGSQHLSKPFGSKSHMCAICNKRFTSYESYHKHKCVYMKAKQLRCSKEEMSNAMVYTEHMKKHENLYSCRMCGKQFTDRKSHLNHCEEHGEFGGGIGSSGVDTDKLDGGRRQLAESAGNLVVDDSTTSSDLSGPFDMHSCHLCNKKFKHIYYLKEHLEIHAETKPYKCGICHKNLPSRRRYNRHIQMHRSKERYSCKLCDRGYTLRHVLMQHIKISHKLDAESAVKAISENKLIEEGGKSEATASEEVDQKVPETMREIKKVPVQEAAGCRKEKKKSKEMQDTIYPDLSGKKHLTCPLCRKVCSCRSNLNDHIISHSNDKPWYCPLCKIKFKRLWDRNRHIRNKHSCEPKALLEKCGITNKGCDPAAVRYECTMCDKSFLYDSVLKIHMKYHTGESALDFIAGDEDYYECAVERNEDDGFPGVEVDLEENTVFIDEEREYSAQDAGKDYPTEDVTIDIKEEIIDIDDIEDIVTEDFDEFDAEMYSLEHSPLTMVTEKVDEIVIVNRDEISSDPNEKMGNVNVGESSSDIHEMIDSVTTGEVSDSVQEKASAVGEIGISCNSTEDVDDADGNEMSREVDGETIISSDEMHCDSIAKSVIADPGVVSVSSDGVGISCNSAENVGDAGSDEISSEILEETTTVMDEMHSDGVAKPVDANLGIVSVSSGTSDKFSTVNVSRDDKFSDGEMVGNRNPEEMSSTKKNSECQEGMTEGNLMCKKVFKELRERQIRDNCLSQKNVYCSLCNITFTSSRQLFGHIHKHTGSVFYQCDVCGETLRNGKLYREHALTHITEYFDWRESLSKKNNHGCTICGKSFTTKHQLTGHMHVHSSAFSRTCEACGETFESNRLVYSHLYQHLTLLFKGAIEPRISKAIENPIEGKRTTKVEQAFTCMLCSKTFEQRGDLEEHERKHQEEEEEKEAGSDLHVRPVADVSNCEVSDESDITAEVSSSVPVNRPYSCMYCSERFQFKDSMRNHMRLHTGD